MKICKNRLSVFLIITAFLVIIIGSTNSVPFIYAQDGHSQSTVCNKNSCYIMTCSGSSPCQSFPTNRPVLIQPESEEVIVMEPVGIVTKPLAGQEAIVMEPVTMQPYNVQWLEENEESQRVVDPVTTEESHYDTSDRDEQQREDYEEEINDHANDHMHKTFEQELHGTPEDLEIETENKGMGIAVDYVVFYDDEQTRILENPDKQYNGGPLTFQREGTISISFADCHNVGCVKPEGINSVYLVDGAVEDEDIINSAIDNNMKYEFEQTDSESFQFNVPDGMTRSNLQDQLVIETQQTDEIRAFYIHEGAKVS